MPHVAGVAPACPRREALLHARAARSSVAVAAEEWPLRELALSLALRGRQLVVFVANDKIQTFKQKQKLANVYAHCTDFDCSTVCTDLSEQIGGVRM